MQILDQVVGWFQRLSRPATPHTHRVFVSLHRGELLDDAMAPGLAALELHDALTSLHTGCALVDIDEWVLRASLEEGRFRPVDLSETAETDPLTDEPAWERERRADIGWLLQNRTRLISEAMRSGGDAQVVILLHSLEFIELLSLWGEKRPGDTVLLYYLGPNQPGLPGYICAPMSPRKGGPAFVFGDNPADDAANWGKLARRITTLLR